MVDLFSLCRCVKYNVEFLVKKIRGIGEVVCEISMPNLILKNDGKFFKFLFITFLKTLSSTQLKIFSCSDKAPFTTWHNWIFSNLLSYVGKNCVVQIFCCVARTRRISSSVFKECILFLKSCKFLIFYSQEC